MDKPRILILGKLPPPFIGPALATEIILNSALRHRFDLHHFDTRINDSVANMGKLQLGKIQIIRKKYRAFKRVVKEVKPNLILIPIGQTTPGFFKDIPFIKMAAKSGARVVIQLRGSAWRDWFDGLDGFRRKAVQKQLRKVDGAIVLGDNLRPIFDGIFPKERIFTVPNGADYSFPVPSEVHPATSAGHSLTVERKRQGLQITYLANYLPGKGILELLEALTILHQKHDLPEYEFNAYGSWDNADYKAKCESLVAGLPHCTLYKSVYGDAKWQALTDSDIFVFAPRSPEGHPWSVVEAMAAGLPIISTDRGAISQSVIDGENGFLLKDPDPEKLAAKLALLIENADLREAMGIKSRALYETEFTAESMVKKLDGVFTKIIESKCAE